MNLQAYIKGCNRGEFQWNCIESGTYGEGNSVDVENVTLNDRWGTVTRNSSEEYSAEVDGLKNEPFYDEKEFSSRKSARKWVERLIVNDINKSR